MPHHELIPLKERTTWTKTLRGLPHSFHHTWDYAYALHRTTDYPTFLYSFRDREVRMACPLVERELAGYVDVATPSGLSGFVGTGSWSEFAPHWIDFVHERGYATGYIGLNPLFGPPEIEHAHQHNSVYVLHLDLGRDELLRRMDRNRRRELRGWEERARDFVLDRNAISEFLATNYEPFMRRVEARAPHLTVEALDFLCHSDECLAVATATSRGLDAVYLFGATPYAGDCLINVATPDGRRHATDLIWYGINAFIERKVAVLNLGGGVREDDSVARAKQRWRPQQLPLWSLRQVYRADAYAELCRLAGVDATAVSNYFPPYRPRLVDEASEAAS